MVGGNYFYDSVFSIDFYFMVSFITVRQKEDHRSPVTGLSELFTRKTYADMEGQDKGQGKSTERSNICHYFQSPVNSGYSPCKLLKIQFQMGVED